jgi:hypothetical protein
MYFNPSWSHAHSAFSVALFLWYWNRTREGRRLGDLKKWILLGLLAGLMINVYYPNALLLAAPGVEALFTYAHTWQKREEGWPRARLLFGAHLLFCLVTLVLLAPTFITRAIVYGDPLETGYAHLRDYLWRSPAFGAVLFSADHGLFTWTPLLLVSAIGLVLFLRSEKEVGASLLAAALAFYIFISFYPSWDGMSSFGNRFFISLTYLFVIGLAVILQQLAAWFASDRRAYAGAAATVGLLIFWNLEFIFQWGTHMVPVRGPISWREMVHNQVAVVPVRFAGNFRAYLFQRKAMLLGIEEQDAQQLRRQKENPEP